MTTPKNNMYKKVLNKNLPSKLKLLNQLINWTKKIYENDILFVFNSL